MPPPKVIHLPICTYTHINWLASTCICIIALKHVHGGIEELIMSHSRQIPKSHFGKVMRDNSLKIRIKIKKSQMCGHCSFIYLKDENLKEKKKNFFPFIITYSLAFPPR